MRRTVVFLMLVAPVAVAAQQFGLPEERFQPIPDFSQNAQDEVLRGQITIETLDLSPPAGSSQRDAPAAETEEAPGAVLRGLDKITGETTDIALDNGGETRLGRLTVALDACRYPRENPSGDAYALLTVTADGQENPWFQGWMIASSPALSALDHPRYDVWVMRCKST